MKHQPDGSQRKKIEEGAGLKSMRHVFLRLSEAAPLMMFRLS